MTSKPNVAVTSKANVAIVDPVAEILQMDVKNISKIKSIPKLREIYDIHCEELKKIRLLGVQTEEERRKQYLQMESVAEECEQIARDLQKQAGVSAQLEVPFEEERLKGDMQLRYNEHQYESTYRKARKEMHKRKCKVEKTIIKEMLDISNTQDKVDFRLKNLQKKWMERLEHVEDCELEESNENSDSVVVETKEPMAGEMDEIERKNYDDIKDREDLDKIKESMRKQEEMWREFVKDTHKDAYYRVIGNLESMKEETFAKQQEVLNQQFQKILQLKQYIVIKSRAMKELDEIPIYTSDIIEDSPSSASQECAEIKGVRKCVHKFTTENSYFKTLQKKKEKLLQLVHEGEEKIEKLKELLDELETKNEIANYVNLHLNDNLIAGS